MPSAQLEVELSTHILRVSASLLDSTRIAGCQIAVVGPNGILTSHTLGLADIAANKTLQPSHVLKAASGAKTCAAIVALRLVDRHLLTLDDPIWRFARSWQLPADRTGGFDPDAITLRRLLSHTSGLDIRGYPQLAWGTPAPSARDLLDGCFGPEHTCRLVQQPGGTAIYSGAAFTLAQLAMEDATGKPYADLVQEHICTPLGLRHTWVGPRPDRASELVIGHDEANTAVPLAYYPALASSGLYTTAEEMATIFAAVSASVLADSGAASLLKPETAKLMSSPQGRAENGYIFGLGLALAEANGKRLFKHAGWCDGFWGAAEGVTDLGIGAAVLTNSTHGKDTALGLLGAITQFVTTRR